jgi:hypothetical protein
MMRPTPQQKRLPVWFGGPPTKEVMTRIARIGDGWIPIGNVPPDEIAKGTQLLQTAYAAAGRDPSKVQVRAPIALIREAGGEVDIPRTVGGAVDLMRGSGATQAYVGLGQSVTNAADVGPFIAALGQAWRAAT